MNKNTECPVCLLNSSHKLVNIWKEYSFFQCSNCNVVFSFPRKNPGHEWYENSELYKNLMIHSTISNFLNTYVFWYHKQFLNDSSVYGKTLLDIGCGTGSFLNLVQKKYEVWGVDFNRDSINVAKNQFGLANVFANDLDGFVKEKANLKFDIITFFEVLEHQDSPNEFISKIKRLLRPTGYIAMSVPNRNSYVNSLGESDKPPNHLIWWDEQSLKLFLENNGFEIIKLYARKLDSEGLAGDFENKLRFGFGKHIFKKNLGVGNAKIAQKLMLISDYVLKKLFKPTDLFLNMVSLQGSNLYALARIK